MPGVLGGCNHLARLQPTGMYFNRAGELIRNCSLIQFRALCSSLRCLCVAKRHAIIFIRTISYRDTSKTGETMRQRQRDSVNTIDILSENFNVASSLGNELFHQAVRSNDNNQPILVPPLRDIVARYQWRRFEVFEREEEDEEESLKTGCWRGQRNAYHRLQPHRPSDPYLWSPSGVGAVHTTYFTPGPSDTELTLFSASFPPPPPPFFPWENRS